MPLESTQPRESHFIVFARTSVRTCKGKRGCDRLQQERSRYPRVQPGLVGYEVGYVDMKMVGSSCISRCPCLLDIKMPLSLGYEDAPVS